MNNKLSNLKEVSDYAHSLIRDKSEKELKKLDPLELLEWFIASQRFVAEKAVEIIKNWDSAKLPWRGYPKITESRYMKNDMSATPRS